jgi:hypothetical protein
MKKLLFLLIVIFVIATSTMSTIQAVAQELYDYSSADDGEFYNPTEYMGETYDTGETGETDSYQENSIDMDVTDEYQPDGYYEPYDFNFVPEANGNAPNDTTQTQPVDPPVTYDYSAETYDQDTYIPAEQAPVYDEPLQVELDETSTYSTTESAVSSDQNDPISPESEKLPIRFVVGMRQNVKRFIVADKNFNRILHRALVSSNESDWLALNGEIIKVYSDLVSIEPSYPEIYEEFERVNSVLISFVFSGAFGAKDGVIMKWNDRLFAIVGPISKRIEMKSVKSNELVNQLTEVLGGQVRRKFADGTRYISLTPLLDSVNRIMTTVESGSLKEVEILARGLSISGARMKKLINPFFHLLRAKFQQRVTEKESATFKKALEILKI